MYVHIYAYYSKGLYLYNACRFSRKYYIAYNIYTIYRYTGLWYSILVITVLYAVKAERVIQR